MATPPTFVAATRPVVGWEGGTLTRTTPSFGVTTGDILVVLGSSEDGTTAITGITGGGLTWTQQVYVGTASGSSRAAIWTATATSTTSITVSLTSNSSNFFGLVVHQYRTSDGIGASAGQDNLATAAPSMALTTLADNSAISYINGDWAAADGTSRTWRTINSITPTSGNGLESDYYRDSGAAHYAVYAGRWNDVGAAGSKTTGLSFPNTMKPTIAAIEIKGAAAAVPFLASYTDGVGRRRHPKLRGAR